MKKAFLRGSLLAGWTCLAISPAYASETITYTYDALGRLVAVSSSGTVNNGQNVTTAFDPAGNRTNYAVTGAAPPTPTLSIGSVSATEGANLAFTVSLSPTATGTVTVQYATSNGGAVAPGDYTSQSNTLTFTAGQSSKTITIATIDDAAVESAETMTVTLSNATGGAAIGTATGTGTINDNDSVSPANLAIGDVGVTEGGNLVFTVTRSGNTSIAPSASYAAASGTAASGSDFTATSGTVSFAANETTKTIVVATIDDAAVESAETMTVTLSNPSSNTTITTATGTGTINDNDMPPADLAIGNAAATEGGTLAFTVTRSGTTTTAVSASYATASGTATSGSDFTAASGTVSFAANQTSTTINVATADDSSVESSETMSVTLSNPSSGAAITTPTGTGTITDNDTPVQLTDDNLNVLSAHTSVYACYIGGYYDPYYGYYDWEFCQLSSNSVVVYDKYASPTVDPGYALPVAKRLEVAPSYYGTGVSP